MIIIKDNFVCFHRQKDFTQKQFRYFYNRLRLFLVLPRKIPSPKLIFTADARILDKHYGEEVSAQDRAYAFYDEKNNVVMNASRYSYSSMKKILDKRTDPSIFKEFTYIVPIADIYHELIHHLQFHLSDYYNITAFIEATAEIFTFILTGETGKCYLKESKGLWYICKVLMKMNIIDFYGFLIMSIIHRNCAAVFINKKRVIADMATYWDNNIERLLFNLSEYSCDVDETTFWKDINKLHALIFYKF